MQINQLTVLDGPRGVQGNRVTREQNSVSKEQM